MTPKRIFEANKAMRELSAIVLPYQAARATAKLKRRLDEELQIISDLEKGLIAKYGGTVDETGTCKFPDVESAKAFTIAQTEMMNQGDNISLPEVDLSDYTGSINLSASALEALDGIVKFEEANDG